MEGKRIRSSNIELMRIICILMVISGHYFTHGFAAQDLSSTNEIFLKIVGGGSKLAVNCFVIITGYFGKNIYTKRMIPLVKDRWFYSLFTTLLLVICGLASFSGVQIIHTLLPLISCRHNYITSFIVLYFFIPYLNSFLSRLDKSTFMHLLTVETLFFSAIPTIVKPFSNNMYSYILWMMFLFQIGYYLKEHKPNINWKISLLITLAMLIICSVIVEPILSNIIGIKINMYFANTQYSLILLITSVSFFGFFANLKLPQVKVINWLSSSTFAVYILHDDPYVRAVLWSKLLKCENYAHSSFLPVHFFVSVTAIYIACVLVDKIYKLTLSEPLMKCVNYIIENIASLCSKVKID